MQGKCIKLLLISVELYTNTFPPHTDTSIPRQIQQMNLFFSFIKCCSMKMFIKDGNPSLSDSRQMNDGLECKRNNTFWELTN